MPLNHEWQSRVKAVEREYVAMRQAADRLLEAALDGPTNWATYPKAVDLLDGLAARCGIPDTQRDNAHLMRDYRNSLVHERDEKTEAVPVPVARGYLCRFFSFLPPQW